MLLLNSCREWRLLRNLKSSLVGKLARYKSRCQTALPPGTSSGFLHDNELAFIETELLLVFEWGFQNAKLFPDTFKVLEEHLTTICEVLEAVVNRSLISDATSRIYKSYPNLRTLVAYVEAAGGEFSLVNGPHPSLFTIQAGSNTTEVLSALEGLNKVMVRLCKEPNTSLQPWTYAPELSERPKMPFRDCAENVLRTVFRHFNCGVDHDVLLSLPGTAASEMPPRTLEMFLSRCAVRDCWHEVHCVPYDDDFEINNIDDICSHLRRYSGEGSLLELLIQNQGIFTIKELPPSPLYLSGRPPSSLYTLLTSGAFSRADTANFRTLSSLPILAPKQKKAIALRLARCLMEFFDTGFISKTWDLRKIFASYGPESKLSDGGWYATFSKGETPSGSSEFTTDRPIPFLLSFAQLLLAIEEGKVVEPDVDIGEAHHEARSSQIFLRLAKAELAGCGLYADAIRGCLFFHRYLYSELDAKTAEGVDVTGAVRTVIHEKIVLPLEATLDPPRRGQKRRLEDSYLIDTESRRDAAKQNNVREFNENGEHLANGYFLNGPREGGYHPADLPGRGRVVGQQHPERSHQWEPQEDAGAGNVERQQPPCRLLEPPRISLWADPDANNEERTVLKPDRSSPSQAPRPFSPQQQPGPNQSGPPRSQAPRPKGRQDFEIAIICALKVEHDAVEALLDEEFEVDGFSYGKAPGDFNAYTTGRIGQRDVVLACMPNMGKVSSATVAAHLHMSFRQIKVAFLVGVCGAAPQDANGRETFLGDVMISTAVIQVDLGRQYSDGFLRKDTPEDTPSRANSEIRAFLKKLEGKRTSERLEEKTRKYVADLCAEDCEYDYPAGNDDNLYRADYRHKHQNGYSCPTCARCNAPDKAVCEVTRESSCAVLGCSSEQLVLREREETAHPILHFGRFASGDSVMKSGVHRDKIVAKEHVIAFEMEGAGSWDCLPTVIIKSACDYADSHKNKAWQKYASATAAACTKAVLDEWRSAEGC